ncbi:MAG: DUF3305 domain-containing protein, partial [Betaproteobacteria bacterium]
MLPLYFSVDVMMERVPLVNRWVSEQWRPAAVIPVGKLDTGTSPAKVGQALCVRDDAAGTLWRFPDWAIELHPSEAEGYFLNI